MTVPVPGSLTYTYLEDGVTTVFPYPVRFLEPGELTVIRENADGVQTALIYNVDYTVSGAGNPSGGSITRTAAANGGKIIITRATEAKQLVDLQDGQRNPAEAVELQLDRLAMVDQDHSGKIARSLKLGPDKSPIPAGHFPIVDGDGFVVDGGDGADIKEAGQNAAAAEAAANRAEIAAASVGNAKIFDSHGDADGATIDSSIAYARTAGFGSAGDGGGADFVLIDSDPSMPGQWSPADGRFAELVPAPRYKPSPFGILPEDDGAAALINDVFSWLTARRGGGIIELLPESYYATETISPKSGCAFVGAGGAGQYPRVANAESANFKALWPAADFSDTRLS